MFLVGWLSRGFAVVAQLGMANPRRPPSDFGEQAWQRWQDVDPNRNHPAVWHAVAATDEIRPPRKVTAFEVGARVAVMMFVLWLLIGLLLPGHLLSWPWATKIVLTALVGCTCLSIDWWIFAERKWPWGVWPFR